MPNRLVLVVVDGDGPILLAVEINLLTSLFILEANLVGSAAANGGVGLQGALGLFGGQIIGRHVVAVIHAPTMIGRSGSPSRKSTITSWPMRGMWIPPHRLPAQFWVTRIQQELFLIVLAFPVPVKLDLDAPVFVRIDLFSGRAGDDGGLGALDLRFGRYARRSELDGARNCRKRTGTQISSCPPEVS